MCTIALTFEKPQIKYGACMNNNCGCKTLIFFLNIDIGGVISPIIRGFINGMVL